MEMHIIFATIALSSIIGSNSFLFPKRKPMWNKYCNRSPCPEYKIIKTYSDFEVRQYPLYKWAAANTRGVSMYWANYYNLQKIYKYVTGKNEEKVTMPFTLPLITRITESDSSTFEKDFTSLYWIPQKFQANPPNPLVQGGDVEVTVIEWEDRTVYVRSFGGWATESKIRYNIGLLRQSLDNAGIEYDDFFVYSMTYNRRHQIFWRHNEVMFIK